MMMRVVMLVMVMNDGGDGDDHDSCGDDNDSDDPDQKMMIAIHRCVDRLRLAVWSSSILPSLGCLLLHPIQHCPYYYF